MPKIGPAGRPDPKLNHLLAASQTVTIGPSSLSTDSDKVWERLTDRELQVLRLLSDGLTTKAVSSVLGIAFKTAACHRYRILAKLGVTETVSAMRWAIRAGVIEP